MERAEAQIARRAASRLAPDAGSALPQFVERSLVEKTGEEDVDRYEAATLISLGSLIVSVAGLAWKIYRDLRTDTDVPTREVLLRGVRVEVRERTSADGKLVEQVSKAVVEEVLVQADL